MINPWLQIQTTMGLPPGMTLPPGVTLPPGTNVLSLATLGSNETLAGTGAGTTGAHQQPGFWQRYEQFTTNEAQSGAAFGEKAGAWLMEAILGPNYKEVAHELLYEEIGVALILIGALALALPMLLGNMPSPQVSAGPVKVSLKTPSKDGKKGRKDD